MSASFSIRNIIAAAITACCLLPAQAQQRPSLFHYSPSPWHTPAGDIDTERAFMAAMIAPGSCLRGTFISADITALEIPRIRVAPDAEFWPHNARVSLDEPNPWTIAPEGTQAEVRGLPAKLRADILARVGRTSDFVVFYTGADLVRRFGFTGC